MKKSDFASFVVYVLMLALALLVGLLVIRPAVSEWNINNSILVILLSALAGIIINSLLIEGFHALGAKAGGYFITSFVVLGLGVKRQADGKHKFAFSGFEGLTGETKVVPKDIKKSSLSPMIVLPLLAYLIEVVVLIIVIALVSRQKNMGNTNLGWLYIGSIVTLTAGGMIYIFNYFPAHLDVETDGYRMVVLNKAINKQAYNTLLLAEDKAKQGLPADPVPVYDEVTDFTYSLNQIAVYQAVEKEDYRGAIKIVSKTFESPDHISQSIKNEAMAMKLSLVLLTTKREDGATYYQGIDNDQRKYIAELNDAASLRCYLLVAGVVEGSMNETNYALDKVEKIFKKTPDTAKKAERSLIELSFNRIHLLHPDWTLDFDPKSLDALMADKKSGK